MENHDYLEPLLARWEELREQGQEVAAQQLCADRPEWAAALQHQIDRLKAMDWLDASLEATRPFDEQRNSSLEVHRPDFPVPRTLAGRYQLENRIAEGGFGQVWRATDTSLQRSVAVKVTTVNCYTEARRVARLTHHGIISVHDVGNQDGLCFIVFDLVEGTDLAQRIKQGPMPWREAVRLVAEVAEYSSYAHEKGFIHRDIKPANILLDEKGRPVLADFGIAVTECELRHEAVTSVGTLAYMSPEQLTMDSSIDVRTDIYSLGVVLYELLTGQLPFNDPTVSGLRLQILTQHPKPIRAVPPGLERLCLKCLSKRVEDRPPTARDLADALRGLLGSDS
jgi:serine/threonine-protein kinase